MTAAAQRLERRAEYSAPVERSRTGQQRSASDRLAPQGRQRVAAPRPRARQDDLRRAVAPRREAPQVSGAPRTRQSDGRESTRAGRRPAENVVGARSASPARSRAQARPAPLARRSDRLATAPAVAPLSPVVSERLFRQRADAERHIAHPRERHLRAVPRPRRFASVLAPAIVMVLAAMLGIATFQTRMAQNQVEIDQLQRSIDRARSTKQSLERQRAELRSPLRLGREAEAMGMVQASAVGFVQVDLETYTAAIAASGQMSRNNAGTAP